MSELEELLGTRVVTKKVDVKIYLAHICLEIGEEIQVVTVDPELDRALIEYPGGKLDWKRSFWIRDHSKKLS